MKPFLKRERVSVKRERTVWSKKKVRVTFMRAPWGEYEPIEVSLFHWFMFVGALLLALRFLVSWLR